MIVDATRTKINYWQIAR